MEINNRLKELENLIVYANEQYRNGESVISDLEYDDLVSEYNLLKKDDEFDDNAIMYYQNIDDDNGRKDKLPIIMASMNKIKKFNDIVEWVESKKLYDNQQLIITPKYDGVSLCVDEEYSNAWTRGDGVYGQKSDIHFNKVKYGSLNDKFKYTYGELIIPNKTFTEKYTELFSNARNMVSGLINSKTVNDYIQDAVYVRYGGMYRALIGVTYKSDIIDHLNETNVFKVPYEVITLGELKVKGEDFLKELYNSYSVDFEIDGLIIELNELTIQNDLGRERNNNPSFARAYKSPDFEKTCEATVNNITWNISKQGLLKPIININTIHLDGVNISNITGNNARFIKESGIGVGSKILVKRSGKVIPLVYKVLEKVDFVEPKLDGMEIFWNDNGIELVVLNSKEQEFKKIVSFFEILEADNVSEGILKQLWEAGFNTIDKIINITKEDMVNLEGFGERKSEIVYNSINKSIVDVQLSKLQHASGYFDKLGSKKLLLLEDFYEKSVILDDILKVEGFAETSANIYLNNIDAFKDFVNKHPKIKIRKTIIDRVSNVLENKTFVFTGVRSSELENQIIKLGGKIGSSVSKNTTYLVVKERGSGSSKENKAIELGVGIFSLSELSDYLISIC